MTLESYAEDPNPNVVKVLDDGGQSDLVRGISGEVVRVLKKPDLTAVESGLKQLYDDGYRSIAICFVHSYTYPGVFTYYSSLIQDHEILVGELAKKTGFSHVSLSSSLMPMVDNLYQFF